MLVLTLLSQPVKAQTTAQMSTGGLIINRLNPLISGAKMFFGALEQEGMSVTAAYQSGLVQYEMQSQRSAAALARHMLTVKVENLVCDWCPNLQHGTWLTFLPKSGDGGIAVIDTFIGWAGTFQSKEGNIRISYRDALQIIEPYIDNLSARYTDVDRATIIAMLGEATENGILLDDRVIPETETVSDDEWLDQQLTGTNVSRNYRPRSYPGSGGNNKTNQFNNVAKQVNQTKLAIRVESPVNPLGEEISPEEQKRIQKLLEENARRTEQTATLRNDQQLLDDIMNLRTLDRRHLDLLIRLSDENSWIGHWAFMKLAWLVFSQMQFWEYIDQFQNNLYHPDYLRARLRLIGLQNDALGRQARMDFMRTLSSQEAAALRRMVTSTDSMNTEDIIWPSNLFEWILVSWYLADEDLLDHQAYVDYIEKIIVAILAGEIGVEENTIFALYFYVNAVNHQSATILDEAEALWINYNLGYLTNESLRRMMERLENVDGDIGIEIHAFAEVLALPSRIEVLCHLNKRC
ncbi:MAG: hypothetical protein R3A45_08545 [Bdellovibrionota bacterium]